MLVVRVLLLHGGGRCAGGGFGRGGDGVGLACERWRVLLPLLLLLLLSLLLGGGWSHGVVLREEGLRAVLEFDVREEVFEVHVEFGDLPLFVAGRWSLHFEGASFGVLAHAIVRELIGAYVAHGAVQGLPS